MNKLVASFQVPQTRIYRCLVALCCLFIGAWSLPTICSADDVFVGSFNGSNSGIYEYTSTGTFIGLFGPADTFPLGAAFDSTGAFFVSDSDTDTVLKFNGTTSVFASADNAAGIAFGPTGELFVVGSSSPGLLTVLNGTTGAVITTSDAGGILSDPEGITKGPDGNMYVAGGDGKDVLEFNGTTGAFIKEFVPAGSGGLTSARGVAFGPDGNLYVTSFGTNQVLEYNGTTGAFIGSFAQATGACSGLSLPRGLTFNGGNLFVSSFGSGDVFEFNGSTGACISDFIPADNPPGFGGPTFVLFGEPGGSTTVPEPSLFALVACGLMALAAMTKRRALQ